MSRRPETRSQGSAGSISSRRGNEEREISQRIISEGRQVARIEGVDSDSYEVVVSQLRAASPQELNLSEDNREEEQIVEPVTMASQGSQRLNQNPGTQTACKPPESWSGPTTAPPTTRSSCPLCCNRRPSHPSTP